MKQFNKQITVSVEVDAIANQLLNTINPDNKHRETITESIIGSLVNNNAVTALYNALNGFTNDINFKIGDVVDIKDETVYNWDEESQSRTRKPIGIATIVDIDLYKESKVCIEYDSQYDKGSLVKRETRWISHTLCNKVVAATTATLADIHSELDRFDKEKKVKSIVDKM